MKKSCCILFILSELPSSSNSLLCSLLSCYIVTLVPLVFFLIVTLSWNISTDDSWISFLRPRDWDILIMDALLHVPANEGKQTTFRINLTEKFSPAACVACTDCQSPEADKS